MDLDLFDQIRILQVTMVVRGEIFRARIPIGIRIVANPMDLMEALLNEL
jgi:hypothetical protein